MSETPPAVDAPQLEGRMYLFRKPELLTREKHGDLGVSRPDRPFAFCEAVRAVPITISEVALVQKHYPIIFSAPENPLPLAVVGVIDDVNLFVGDDGEWEQNCYVPGYLRRYPFALASDKESDRMAIVIDAEYEGVTQDGEIRFFEGEDTSEQTKQAMEYCTTYERDRMMTQKFAEALAPYDLVTNQVAQFTPEGGETQPFAQYSGVEESRLANLPDDKFLELRKSNMLPILYAQLMSMGNWRLMMDRRVRRFNLASDKVMEPITKQ